MSWTRIAKRTVAALAIAFAAVYAGDFVYLRLRMLHPTTTNPFESMTRTRVLAIPQKSGKFDYQIDQVQPVETITCVHSLLPHYGDQPCWYLKPHLNQPIRVS